MISGEKKEKIKRMGTIRKHGLHAKCKSQILETNDLMSGKI
jgi:hypothetical protein